MHGTRFIHSIFVFALFAAFPLYAADPPSPPSPINIPRTDASIEVDGDLRDAGWGSAATIDQFYETSPGDNVPAKVKTITYLTYDDAFFYIGIRAEDPNASQIRAPYVDRDGVIGTDDNIAVFIDTRSDKRSAIELRVSPRGIQADAIFNDANFNEDFSPDFFYDTAARIDKTGWSAEFRIPFSSLRYGNDNPQTWNILVWRNYPREYRYAFHSAPIPRGSNCLICHSHPITGLADLPKAGHMVAAPYVTAQQQATPRAELGSPLASDDFEGDAGIDVKWNPSAESTIDLTLNPDFSQVEADVAQITVNQRFAVFYPEKRPFFLEGFDLFDTPLQVAYTRTVTSPRWGARATGILGDTAYTALVAQDRGGGLTILPGPLGSGFAPQDFRSYAAIARVRHSLGSSFVGGVFTDREIDGGGHNRVIGPDFQWRPNRSHSITGQFLYSDTTDPVRPDVSEAWNGDSATSHAATVSWFRQTQAVDWGVVLTDIGDGFRADLGFMPQAGYREIEASYGRRFYPTGIFRFVRPSVFVQQELDRENETIFRAVSLGVNGYGIKNMQFFLGVRPEEEVLVGDELLSQTYMEFFFQLDPFRRMPRISLQGRTGESIDFANGRVGDGTSLNVAATVRPHDRLNLQLNLGREWLDATGGRVFTATVQRVRAQYFFSAKSLIRVIGQHVETERNPALYRFEVPPTSGSFLGSVLYSYKLNWQTVLFVGYGDDRLLTESNDLVETGRSVFLKISYAYQR